MVRSRQFVLATAVSALLLAACGTRVDKDAFYESLRTAPSTVTTTAPGSGAPVTNGSGSSRTDGGSRVLGGTVTRPGSNGGTQGPVTSTGGGSGIPANVSTKVIGDEILVGIHVPVTGAAPLPTNWSDSLKVVTDYVNETGIHGRSVRFVVEDDAYDPARGLAACRKLADQNVLFVIGHTMPTVQDSCANFFNARGIPYLMRGTPEYFLEDRPLAYFGTTSDDRQARLLARYALQNLGARDKVSAVVTENDQPVSKREFAKVIEAGGGTIGAIENSTPRQPDFGSIIQKLQNVDADIVFLNIAPVDAIKIAVQAQGVGYHPTWIGEGTHWNYNLSMESAGMALDGAVVFSPWPSIDSAAANPYKEAFRKFNPQGKADDIGLIIWGWGMLARQALLDAGPQLSRATLVGALNQLDFNKPYWNPVSYTASDHRGPTAVTVFRGDGQAKRWRQVEGFRSSF